MTTTRMLPTQTGIDRYEHVILADPVDPSSVDEQPPGTHSPWYGQYGQYDYRPRLRSYFDDDNLRYLCCCNRMHVKSAAYLVVLFELLLLGLRSVDLAFVAMNGLCIRLFWDSLEIGIWLFAIMLLLPGLRVQSANLLVPHCVVQITYIVLLVGVLVLTGLYCVFGAASEVVWVVTGSEKLTNDEYYTNLVIGGLVLTLTAALFINSFFLSIVLRCHNYFIDFSNYMKESGTQT